MNLDLLSPLQSNPNSGLYLSFERTNEYIERTVSRFDNEKQHKTRLPMKHGSVRKAVSDARSTYEKFWLETKVRPTNPAPFGSITVADLFSGCGGMSLGIDEACRALGKRAEHVFAAELNPTYADVYAKNFGPKVQHVGDINEVMPGALSVKLSCAEEAFSEKVGRVDILCGGPPCQGHSDLNNYTRRYDPRNSLYNRMARAAEIFRPKSIIIENVPGVRRDRTGVFSETVSFLEQMGYAVKVVTLDASKYGVPQTRKRTFVLALSDESAHAHVQNVLTALEVRNARTSLWAIDDTKVGNTDFDLPSVLSEESQKRVQWLYENEKHELPDVFRPDCHRLKRHTYKSVYGRMYASKPAPTITTGCLVMGQGRFIHPTQPRTITPHEAARLQTFPDFFKFGQQNRTGYAKMIGNAVPPLLSFAIGLGIASI